MIRIVVEKPKKPKKLDGLIYYKNGHPLGEVKFYFAPPRKQGQRDYEFEEVNVEVVE